MEKPFRKWTKEDSETETFYHKNSIEKLEKKLSNYFRDPDIGKRSNKIECKYCFYINTGRLAGQAFTNSYCGICGEKMIFSTTDTNKLCPKCAEEHNMCKHCGGELD